MIGSNLNRFSMLLRLGNESWKASSLRRNYIGNSGRGLIGYSQGTRTLNVFTEERWPERRRIRLARCWMVEGSVGSLSRVCPVWFLITSQICASLSSHHPSILLLPPLFLSVKLMPIWQADLERLSPEQRMFQIRPLAPMGPNKAPGSDGFHALFFQKFWNVVGEDVSSVCLKVLNGGCSIEEFNATNVVLISKVKNPERMTDFRPISLRSVIYKTVSKVMANRLKEILPHIISSEQSAFVPGRLIFDNIMVAFELLHSIKKQKKGKRGYAAIKLDMSKAYDGVEWGFLEIIMEKLGFPNHFRALVMDCVSTSKLSFHVNGKSVEEVTPQRGLRHGCPLSPYLFLLCTEALSTLIKGNESNGQSLGMRCCRGSPLVSHLFFCR
ncbi:hypothetical protein ACOSQ4_004586 [Xanthoceras sorbifolium]